jgi:dTDP-4-dehydrorhamnose 3,5-epimerase
MASVLEVTLKYTDTDIDGVTVVDIEPNNDERGFFARSFCADEFAKQGLDSTVAQVSFAYSHARGTLRGLHWQVPPFAEAKLVRCTRGAIFAVAVDIRPESETFSKQVTVELTAENRRALFLPPYVAHGFQTLADDTEAMHQVSGPYEPRCEQGFRWNDPEFGISWPLPITVISEKDAGWPLIAEVDCVSR